MYLSFLREEDTDYRDVYDTELREGMKKIRRSYLNTGRHPKTDSLHEPMDWPDFTGARDERLKRDGLESSEDAERRRTDRQKQTKLLEVRACKRRCYT